MQNIFNKRKYLNSIYKEKNYKLLFYIDKLLKKKEIIIFISFLFTQKCMVL